MRLMIALCPLIEMVAHPVVCGQKSWLICAPCINHAVLTSSWCPYEHRVRIETKCSTSYDKMINQRKPTSLERLWKFHLVVPSPVHKYPWLNLWLQPLHNWITYQNLHLQKRTGCGSPRGFDKRLDEPLGLRLLPKGYECHRWHIRDRRTMGRTWHLRRLLGGLEILQ